MRLVFLIVFISLFLSGCFPGYADLEKKRLLKINTNTNTNKTHLSTTALPSLCFYYHKNIQQKIVEQELINRNYNKDYCNTPEGEALYKDHQNKINKQNIEKQKREQELIKRNREKNNPEAKRNREIEEHNRKLVKQKKEQEILIKKEKQIFENAKAECEAIGYKKGTEKFGECVLDLTE